MHEKISFGFSLTASILLAACGGGSNGAAETAPTPLSSPAPAINLQPSDQNVSVGQPATFTVAATGTAPLSHQWQRNTSAIAGVAVFGLLH
jgi:hypothetical protein